MPRTLNPEASTRNVAVWEVTDDNGVLLRTDYVPVPDSPLDIAVKFEDELTQRIDELQEVIDYADPPVLAVIAGAPDLPSLPAGPWNLATTEAVLRAVTGYVQEHRVAARATAQALITVTNGVQLLARIEQDLFRLVRGDFSNLD